MSELLLRVAGAKEAVAEASSKDAVTPGRIMAPRLIFAACALGLVFFGFLMIYSSSSIVGLTSKAYDFDPTYFLVRQVAFAGVGLVVALVLAHVDYHVWSGTLLKVVWGVTLLSLVLVYTPIAGHDAYGASRWIGIGSFSLQPSEFAKITIILVGAHLANEYFARASLEPREALKLFLIGVALPLALVLWQPDKGTTGVLVLTLCVMVYLAGVPGWSIGAFAVLAVLAALVYSFKDEYSRARILTMLDPFRDEYGDGYQLVQGFYALGSGGLTGMGLGMSRQKYSYLPMAHNDFIFAVVGEELGFVGAVALLAAFCLLLWAGLKIAQNAPDLTGRLIAAGCTSLIIIQLLLNVSGVIGLFPLSGKPVPFVSYGGSSIISSLMLVGLVLSVSLRSKLPDTSYERRRAKMRIASGAGAAAGAYVAYDSRVDRDVHDDLVGLERGIEGSTAGRAMPRSASLVGGRSNLRVVEGGATTAPSTKAKKDASRPSMRSAPLAGRVSVDSQGRRRIDLSPSPADRLRGRRN